MVSKSSGKKEIATGGNWSFCGSTASGSCVSCDRFTLGGEGNPINRKCFKFKRNFEIKSRGQHISPLRVRNEKDSSSISFSSPLSAFSSAAVGSPRILDPVSSLF